MGEPRFAAVDSATMKFESQQVIDQLKADVGGGGSITIITSDTTTAAGSAAGQLVWYRNASSASVTVNGSSLAAGTGAIFEWSGRSDGDPGVGRCRVGEHLDRVRRPLRPRPSGLFGRRRCSGVKPRGEVGRE